MSKTNLNVLVADIVRRLPDLVQDKANAETVLLVLIKPLADERDAAIFLATEPQRQGEKTF